MQTEIKVDERGTSEAVDSMDLVIEVYKKDVDRTILRENLKLTPSERVKKFGEFLRQQAEIRGSLRQGTSWQSNR